MHDASHITVISNVATSAWLIDCCHKDAAFQLEKSFKKFHRKYQYLIEKYQRLVKKMVNDAFPG